MTSASASPPPPLRSASARHRSSPATHRGSDATVARVAGREASSEASSSSEAATATATSPSSSRRRAATATRATERSGSPSSVVSRSSSSSSSEEETRGSASPRSPRASRRSRRRRRRRRPPPSVATRRGDTRRLRSGTRKQLWHTHPTRKRRGRSTTKYTFHASPSDRPALLHPATRSGDGEGEAGEEKSRGRPGGARHDERVCGAAGVATPRSARGIGARRVTREGRARASARARAKWPRERANAAPRKSRGSTTRRLSRDARTSRGSRFRRVFFFFPEAGWAGCFFHGTKSFVTKTASFVEHAPDASSGVPFGRTSPALLLVARVPPLPERYRRDHSVSEPFPSDADASPPRPSPPARARAPP